MVLNPVINKLTGKLVVLASASPRRLEILTNVGLRFEVVPSWFKETLDKALFKDPQDYAVETARQKALEVARRMPYKHLKTPDIVIGADTVVTVDGHILEKPSDKQDAYRMLSSLSGKEHSVFTGVAIVLCQEKEDKEVDFNVVDFYEETKVKFAELSEDMLWEYINSGEPMDKAGGYGIQALGGMLVEYVHGDFLNVVGFPLNHFCKTLGTIYNSPPESPVHKIAREDSSGETWPLVNSLSKCAENGELEPSDPANDSADSEAVSISGASASGVQEQNVVGPESASESASPCSCNREDFPHKIVDIMDGFKASKALFAACKLNIFDVLSVSVELSAKEVAARIKASEEGSARLLDACVSLGLMERRTCNDGDPVYSNTAEASRFLVADSPLSLHGYILHCNDLVWPLFTHLESAVREGANQYERAFGKKAEDLFQDAYFKKEEVKMRFMKAMHSIAKVTAKDLATAFDLSMFKTACDVGGCTGAMAYEFTQIYPEMSVSVFDLPHVIAMSGRFQPRDPNDRVTFVAGDFFKDPLPKAELYILARILHDWSLEKVHQLLDKLSKHCSPGSGVLVCEILLEEGLWGPSRAFLQALSMTEGSQRSASQYTLLLGQHGFTQTRLKNTNNLLDAMLFLKD
ncbi:probable bifunctional dTTP/UTP pyrophosphatase/methyltransferase protein isoform X2 [Alosa sapidissima]|uniref:probable bifunctional dTTP/UTP pyrophosphatase/methyltransferase protein isoform X2 n=1 Tax=Alosa sapidissima TaxID=34773 RepID=UPI001C08EBAF|nr:probable bifunctional dTTP/UTP pyrophosphatase/methyltransferase protein isoform X2 [Alosa sapidissima]